MFFFNDAATTEIYTLSLHDALPISGAPRRHAGYRRVGEGRPVRPLLRRVQHSAGDLRGRDRKSTRLNSSHANISYAVFCLKTKKPHSPFRSTDFPSSALTRLPYAQH